jgi:hypothetical protein
MATRLKNRNKQIPNGFKFLQPETGWSPPSYSSFNQIVMGLISHRRGNPHLAAKNNWAMETAGIEAEVEAYNVKVCQQHGWKDFITEGASVAHPKQSPPPSLLQLGKRLVAGAKTLAVDWLASGAEAVAPALSADRAAICASCPQNQGGDVSAFFTVPVATAIRAALNLRSEWKLKTPHDDALGVCAACSCPLLLKVHLPIKDIAGRIPAESRAALDPRCWILAESPVEQ